MSVVSIHAVNYTVVKFALCDDFHLCFVNKKKKKIA